MKLQVMREKSATRGYIFVCGIAFVTGMVLSVMLWKALQPGTHGDQKSVEAVVRKESVPLAVLSEKPIKSTKLTKPTEPIKAPILVHVYLTAERQLETVDLETYVSGVVAAEMPVNFEQAALEAQALAARTYIVRRLMLHIDDGIPDDRADVMDSITHQVYHSLKEMDKLRNDDEEAWLKVKAAVKHTEDLVLTNKGKPIEALYFSSSNGYTENSEEVFSERLSYLRAVASPWDIEEAPRSEEVVKLSTEELYHKLGVQDITASARVEKSSIRIAEYTPGRRVKRLAIGSVTLTGTEVRRKLGLRSAAFDLTRNGSEIVITTYGSGHGVGMSQWGAEGMAKDGYTAQQIVEHYYSGIALEEASKLLESTS